MPPGKPSSRPAAPWAGSRGPGPSVAAAELAGLMTEAARLAAAPSWPPRDRERSLVLIRLVELVDMAADDGDDERILTLDAELRSSLGPAAAPVLLAAARGRLVLPAEPVVTPEGAGQEARQAQDAN